MAAPDKKDGAGLPVALLATVLVALAGILVGQWQLVGTRPSPSEIAGYPPGTLQDVPGRLWQDPFAAIDQYLKRPKDAAADQDPKSQRSGRERFGEVIVELNRSGTAPDIVGAMVFGGDYPEYAEQRRRTRYAVVSALSTARFVPEQPEGLGFITPSAGLERQRRVPFEWFRHEGSGRRVLLLWLDENSFDDNRAVAQLVDFMHPFVASVKRAGGRVLFLGPIGSGTLQSMVSEIDGRANWPPDMTFFSTATAASATAASQPKSVVRVIATDRAVMDALIPELKLRGIDPTRAQRPDRIILVSELDTAYGRELPQAFEAAVCEARAPCIGSRPPWVRRFSYLRGLDGKIPGAPHPESKADGDKPAGEGAAPFEPLERAEGPSQVDYLRRLAAHAREVPSDPGDGSSGGEVRAIGVLGSDVYDKSLVLRAFRREFPKAVFFTTDLDARMLHPAEYAWTRNLIVASSFGFSLEPELQRHVPPFRDSYQTAIFLATQCALSVPRAPCAEALRMSPRALRDRIPPRIFESGRGVAFDLGGESPRGIHPEVPRIVALPSPRYLLLSLGIVLSGSLLLYLVSPPLKDGIDGLVQRARAAPSQGPGHRRPPRGRGAHPDRRARRRAGGAAGRALPRAVRHQPLAHGDPPLHRGRALRGFPRRRPPRRQAGADRARRRVRENLRARVPAHGCPLMAARGVAGPARPAADHGVPRRQALQGRGAVGALPRAELFPQPMPARDPGRAAVPHLLRAHRGPRPTGGAHARRLREVDRPRALVAVLAAPRVAHPGGERHHPTGRQIRQAARSLRADQVARSHPHGGGQPARHRGGRRRAGCGDQGGVYQSLARHQGDRDVDGGGQPHHLLPVHRALPGHPRAEPALRQPGHAVSAHDRVRGEWALRRLVRLQATQRRGGRAQPRPRALRAPSREGEGPGGRLDHRRTDRGHGTRDPVVAARCLRAVHGAARGARAPPPHQQRGRAHPLPLPRLGRLAGR